MSTKARWGGSLFSAQWLTFHILEHYRSNLDAAFLEENWDILTASAQFVDSWLIPGPEGTLISRPSASPENQFTYTNAEGKTVTATLSDGITFDQFMILQVFNDYLDEDPKMRSAVLSRRDLQRKFAAMNSRTRDEVIAKLEGEGLLECEGRRVVRGLPAEDVADHNSAAFRI